jgi:hypothetical protein
MYAAIVPTLQRTTLLRRLLDDLAAHDLVDEVLVVNNATQPLEHASAKIRVVSPGRNIYVNPAWNLGVSETTSRRLAIINDDVALPQGLLESAAERLDKGAGIIGAHSSCFSGESVDPGTRVSFRPAWWRTRAFGTFMLMDRASWVPIPEDLQIYFGDDFVFRRQTKTNYTFSGVLLGRHTGTTASSAEFRGFLEREGALFLARYPEDPYTRRYRGRSFLARSRRRARRAVGVAARRAGLAR